MTETARQRPFNPATKAIQFRAWQIAQREAGNITREQIAAEMGETTSRVSRLLRDEKWAGALRVSALDLTDRPHYEAGAHHEAAEIAARLGAFAEIEA